MKQWIKLLAVALLAVSIPIQGFAAVIMPACNSSEPVVNSSVSMPMHSAHMDMSSASVESEHCKKNCCDHSSSHHSCADQKCFLCHLSVFHLHSTEPLALSNDVAASYHDFVSGIYQVFSPPLLHPPKPPLV